MSKLKNLIETIVKREVRKTLNENVRIKINNITKLILAPGSVYIEQEDRDHSTKDSVVLSYEEMQKLCDEFRKNN